MYDLMPILNFFAEHLMFVMLALLGGALTFRWLAYKSSKYDYKYFTTFTQELERKISEDYTNRVDVVDVDDYLENVLDLVNEKLPNRSLRLKGKKFERNSNLGAASQVYTLDHYKSGKKSLSNSILNEIGAFKSQHPPCFNSLAERILEQDNYWTKLFGWIPINGFSRLIDILPGVFVVMGIFGTFVGICMALPEIATIDFNQLDKSSSILSGFVNNVTFAMQTSIAGILLSLTLTFLNTLFPVQGVRENITKKMGESLEMLWYRVQGGTNLEKSLMQVLPRILSSVEKIEMTFEESLYQKSLEKKKGA
jgi:hypothetical protein